MISVLHIGLPLAPPWLSPEDGEQIAARLVGIREQMDAAGFRCDVLHASPDTGLTEFRETLRAERFDAVLIGGGVATDPKLASFKQQIVDATHHEAPHAKVLDFDHTVDVPVLVRRAFGDSGESIHMRAQFRWYREILSPSAITKIGMIVCC